MALSAAIIINHPLIRSTKRTITVIVTTRRKIMMGREMRTRS